MLGTNRSLDCEMAVDAINLAEDCELNIELSFVVTASTEEPKNEVERMLVVDEKIVVEGMYSSDNVMLNAEAAEVRSEESVKFALDVTQ